MKEVIIDYSIIRNYLKYDDWLLFAEIVNGCSTGSWIIHLFLPKSVKLEKIRPMSILICIVEIV
jgi:hypothetical protein